jgi:serine acetyltransferase
VGIVIGSGVKIGTHCILLQGVTLGQAGIYNNSESKYPRIGNHVAFGAYSAALGNISIHDNTLIGAHSVLVNSTVESGLYVGIPAKFVRKVELDEQ